MSRRIVRLNPVLFSLEDRLVPVVGAFEPGMIVPPTAGFAGVVQFGDANRDDDCSGVLLADGRHILTAAHCVDSNGDLRPDADQYTVRFDLPTGPVRMTVPSTDVAVHPGWKGNAAIGDGNDLAILRLPAIAPLGQELGFDLYTGRDELGKTVTFYGYGYIGTGTTGEAIGNGGDFAEIQRLRFDGTGPVTLQFNGEMQAITAPATVDSLTTALEQFTGVQSVRVAVVNTSGNPNNGAFEVVFTNVNPATPGFTGVNVPQVMPMAGGGYIGTLMGTTVADGGVDRLKRVGVNTITDISDEGVGVINANFPSQAGFAVLGAGDSGGPAFIDGKVAGIASFGSDPTTIAPDTTTSWARVSEFIDSFITPVISAAFPLVLDLRVQPVGSDGGPDDIRIYRENFRYVIELNGQRFLEAPITGVSGVSVIGTGETRAIVIDGNFGVPVSTDAPGASVQRLTYEFSVIAAGPGGGPRVRAFAPDGTTVASFFAFEPGFTGGVSAAAADLTGDAIPDYAAAPGPGGGPVVKIFDGKTGSEVRSFFAFDPSFRGGLNIGLGDVTGDGVADIVVAPASGGGPNVKVFDGRTGAEVRSFFAYDPSFRGGIFVAVGDVNGDGFADIITGVAEGGAPHVKVFSGADGSELLSIYGFDPAFTGGVRVAAGDPDADGRADIFLAAGPGAGPHVKQLGGTTGEVRMSLFAYDLDFLGGVSVGIEDDPEGTATRLVVGPASVPAPIRVFGFQNGVIDPNDPFPLVDSVLGVSVGSQTVVSVRERPQGG